VIVGVTVGVEVTTGVTVTLGVTVALGVGQVNPTPENKGLMQKISALLLYAETL
jgi:hypothetical protein